MAWTKCTTRKLFGKNQRSATQAAKVKLTVMSTQKCSLGGCAHHLGSLEIEGRESPLTTLPSSPIPMEEVAEGFRISYTHNHISGIILTFTYFVEFCFFAIVLLFLSGWWKSLLLQPVQKGGVHVLPHCAQKIQRHHHRWWCWILFSGMSRTRRSGDQKQWEKGIWPLLGESSWLINYFWLIFRFSLRVLQLKTKMVHKCPSCLPTHASTLTMGCLPIVR